MSKKTEKPLRTSLVTGGAGGIGTAIKKKLDSKGIHTLLTDISEQTSASDLFFECDVRNPRHIENLYQWVKSNIGVPDILVLNAGVGIKETLFEGDPEKWQRVFDTNVMGALRCLRAFVPEMLERKKGHVVFISSVSAHKPFKYGGVYAASKSALEIIAETLRLETLPHLSVTTISPGATDTGFFKNQLAGASEDKEFDLMDPMDIAEDVFYAISRKASRGINNIVTRPLSQQF